MGKKADNTDTKMVVGAEEKRSLSVKRRWILTLAVNGVLIVVCLIIAFANGTFTFNNAQAKHEKVKAVEAGNRQSVAVARTSTGDTDFVGAEANLKQLAKDNPSVLDQDEYNLTLFETCIDDGDKACAKTAAKQWLKLTANDPVARQNLPDYLLPTIKQFGK